MDLILRNAQALGYEGLVDIGIIAGRISFIGSLPTEKGGKEIDVAGKMVTPGLVEEHTHLDKALTRDWSDQVGYTLDEQIKLGREFKSRMTVDDIIERASTVIKKHVVNGTTALRTGVEADPVIKDKAVVALAEIKKIFGSVIDIQTVAYPQEGWFCTPGTIELGSEDHIVRAMQLGTDVVGGNINAGIWPSNPKEQIDKIFSLAKEFDAPIDVHIDNYDSEIAFSLPYLCQKTIEYNYQGRVVAAHAIGTAHVDSKARSKVIEQVAEANITIGVMPIRMRLTSVREFMEAGVNVVVGSDGYKDAFVYMSNPHVLHSMMLLAHQIRARNKADLHEVFKMGTTNAARALGLADYGLGVGNNADLVIFEAESLEEVIMELPPCRYVLKGGKIVAENGRYIGL